MSRRLLIGYAGVLALALCNTAYAADLTLVGSGSDAGLYTAPGTLTMRGVSWSLTNAGSTFTTLGLEQGQLQYNGTTTSTATLAVGTHLSGTGRYAAILALGTIGPGVQQAFNTGTITVTGNFSAGTGFNYHVNVDGSGATDLIAVTGRATISGQVTIMPIPGTYAASTDYTIMTAGGGIDGTFTGMGNAFPIFTPTLTYEANAIRLRLVNNSASGDIYPSLGTTALQMGQRQLTSLGSILSDPSLGDLVGASGWVSGGHRFFKLNDGVAESLKGDHSDVLAGTAFPISGTVAAGIYAGLGFTDTEGSGGANFGDMNSKIVGGYAITGGALFRLAATYAHSWDDYEVTRTSAAQSSFGGHRNLAMAQVSYLAQTDMFELMPRVGLSYVRAHQAAFEETGTSNATASGDGSSFSSLTSRAGARVTVRLLSFQGAIFPYAGLAWAHEFKAGAPRRPLEFSVAAGSVFSVNGVARAKDMGEGEAGLAYRAGAFGFAVGYEGVRGRATREHAVRGTLSFGW